ncbi:unnamed protein product [Clonostachys solani]|uniref:Uncharacterized protein n=1 Tax=Clonostachys solani TaxID=160281 RepID=A0A9N9Z469_9HYPO|nr:unnamed protein product [Clonostachys solani]
MQLPLINAVVAFGLISTGVASPRVTGIGAGPLLLPTDGRNAKTTAIAASTTDAAAGIARIAVAAVDIHECGSLQCAVLDAGYAYIGWVRKTPRFNTKDSLGSLPSMFTLDLYYVLRYLLTPRQQYTAQSSL